MSLSCCVLWAGLTASPTRRTGCPSCSRRTSLRSNVLNWGDSYCLLETSEHLISHGSHNAFLRADLCTHTALNPQFLSYRCSSCNNLHYVVWNVISGHLLGGHFSLNNNNSANIQGNMTDVQFCGWNVHIRKYIFFSFNFGGVLFLLFFMIDLCVCQMYACFIKTRGSFYVHGFQFSSEF